MRHASGTGADRGDARPVQGCRARDAGAFGRRYATHVRQPRECDGADEGREAAGACVTTAQRSKLAPDPRSTRRSRRRRARRWIDGRTRPPTARLRRAERRQVRC